MNKPKNEPTPTKPCRACGKPIRWLPDECWDCRRPGKRARRAA